MITEEQLDAEIAKAEAELQRCVQLANRMQTAMLLAQGRLDGLRALRALPVEEPADAG